MMQTASVKKKPAVGFWQGKGKTLLAVVLLIVGGIAAYLGYKSISSDGADSANHRIFIDAKTGQSYEYDLTISTPIPAPSPFTHENTGYPAELCYWTKDGQIKKDPTPVLMRDKKEPGYRGPTFCPDCGRLVVGHNPRPREGSKPPPTEEEWKASHPE